MAWEVQQRRSGITREEWMFRASPYVRRLIESGEHPMFARVVMDARQPHMGADASFRYGLERVLDCIEAALPSVPGGHRHRAD
jgi:hypothetical protein